MHYHRLKRTILAGAIMLTLSCTALTGCSSSNNSETPSTTTAPTTSSNTTTESGSSDSSTTVDYSTWIQANELIASYEEEDTKTDWKDSSYEEITLDGTTISSASSKVTVNGSVATITGAGTYHVSGTVSDGQLVIDAGKEDLVWIILDNASLSSSTTSPFYVKNAKKVILTLEDGTTNTITDAATYADTTSTDAPDSALFASDDLTINGTGSLNVTGNYNDGITCKDTLKIMSGTITVTAADDGIRGKDALLIHEGTFHITAGGDGLKSNNTSDTTKGYIILESGTYEIQSHNDAIQAETSLLIKDGAYTITTTGTADTTTATSASSTETSSTSTSDSYKGLKAGNDIYITGGSFLINSTDDAVHTNNTVTIDNGTFAIQTGDDGMHADSTLTINGGTIDIQQSYEGLEGKSVQINDGNIKVVSSDDGINAGGGSDTESTFGAFGQDRFSSSSSDSYLEFNGGTIYVNANGDGLDSNGSIKQTGGTVTVDGPTNGGNGSLDYDSTYDISGGILVAVGAQSMAQTTSESSTSNSIYFAYSSVQAANTSLTLKDASGNTIYSYTPSKEYQCAIISAPEIQLNETYTLYSGDTKLCDVTPTTNVAAFSDSGESTSAPSGMGGGGHGGMNGSSGGKGGMNGQGGTRPDRNTGDSTTSDGQPPVAPSGEPPELPSGEVPSGEAPSTLQNQPTEATETTNSAS